MKTKQVFLMAVIMLLSTNIFSQETIEDIENIEVAIEYEDITYGFCKLKYGGGHFTYSTELETDAKNGNVSAQRFLGQCYLEGYGVQKDYEKALYWINKALENNNLVAMHLMGVIYEEGYGVKKDPFQAFLFYKKAALRGQREAFVDLAKCYRDGIGTSKDLIRAKAWFKKGALADIRVAQLNYGQILIYLDDNYTEGLVWLEKAAAQGSAIAYYEIAYCYEMGLGVPKDTSKALSYYKKAYSINPSDEASQKIKQLQK